MVASFRCGVSLWNVGGDYSGWPLHIGLLIATFRCAAPARCGAFADQRRIVMGDEAALCDAIHSSGPLGQCDFRSGLRVVNAGLGLSASAYSPHSRRAVKTVSGFCEEGVQRGLNPARTG